MATVRRSEANPLAAESPWSTSETRLAQKWHRTLQAAQEIAAYYTKHEPSRASERTAALIHAMIRCARSSAIRNDSTFVLARNKRGQPFEAKCGRIACPWCGLREIARTLDQSGRLQTITKREPRVRFVTLEHCHLGQDLQTPSMIWEAVERLKARLQPITRTEVPGIRGGLIGIEVERTRKDDGVVLHAHLLIEPTGRQLGSKFVVSPLTTLIDHWAESKRTQPFFTESVVTSDSSMTRVFKGESLIRTRARYAFGVRRINGRDELKVIDGLRSITRNDRESEEGQARREKRRALGSLYPKQLFAALSFAAHPCHKNRYFGSWRYL